ncbi:hypothetical protein CAter282_1517 [Collimonas arenae]|uniref:Uncharacterized protein n=1 Tax=Collimonas arenae TaxID=279058 RepID=A0A127PP57_9BURK|nr:hypothetical protein CAter10_1640 [Collimonas arenae]AMP09306.1 hypothetical protein CAter282_1517 [Collimonas arenae]
MRLPTHAPGYSRSLRAWRPQSGFDRLQKYRSEPIDLR